MAKICLKFIDIWFEYIIPNSIFHVYILNKKLLPHTRLDKTPKGEYYVTICMQHNVGISHQCVSIAVRVGMHGI